MACRCKISLELLPLGIRILHLYLKTAFVTSIPLREFTSILKQVVEERKSAYVSLTSMTCPLFPASQGNPVFFLPGFQAVHLLP